MECELADAIETLENIAEWKTFRTTLADYRRTSDALKATAEYKEKVKAYEKLRDARRVL